MKGKTSTIQEKGNPESDSVFSQHRDDKLARQHGEEPLNYSGNSPILNLYPKGHETSKDSAGRKLLTLRS